MPGMEGETTDGIDGRLTEDNLWQRDQRDGEKAEIFLRARGQATPAMRSGPPQFSAHRLVLLSQLWGRLKECPLG